MSSRTNFPHAGRRAVTALLAATLAVAVSACGGRSAEGSLPALGNGKQSPAVRRVFLYTGRRESFVVPRTVTQVTVDARGAAGGGADAGRGGRVVAIVSVIPGERIIVAVGGAGSRKSGGFNGGAHGGTAPRCSATCQGGGGGGASDVTRVHGSVLDKIVVAGGGGGEGGRFGPRFGVGGEGGGAIGGNGGDGNGPRGSGYGCGGSGGGGGTQRSGGPGGGAGSCYEQSGGHGQNGRPGVGGLGGAAHPPAGGGGGAGGGYYGGGGGGGATAVLPHGGGGGGGGGGSSHAQPSAKILGMWRGWKDATGNGLVVISW